MRIPKDDRERQALSDVTEFGLHVVHVSAAGSLGPCFTYSVGLFKSYGHAEIIIIGLRQELAHAVLNNLAFDIKDGKIFKPNEFYPDILEGFLCYFGDVSQGHYREYVGWNLWFYEGFEFPLVQCVYPTTKGKFPWDKDFPAELYSDCLLLTEPPTT